MRVLSLVLMIGMGLAGCADAAHDACVERGIQFYKDYKQYPTMSDGKPAEAQVHRVCGGNPSAFKNGKP